MNAGLSGVEARWMMEADVAHRAASIHAMRVDRFARAVLSAVTDAAFDARKNGGFWQVRELVEYGCPYIDRQVGGTCRVVFPRIKARLRWRLP